MATVLLVVRPFDTRRVGDLIDGALEMRRVLAGVNTHDVIKVSAPISIADKPKES